MSNPILIAYLINNPDQTGYVMSLCVFMLVILGVLNGLITLIQITFQ